MRKTSDAPAVSLRSVMSPSKDEPLSARFSPSRNNRKSLQLETSQSMHVQFQNYVKTAAQTCHPQTDISPKAVELLSSFLQDTMVWAVNEAGNHSKIERSEGISSRHIQIALQKLLGASSSGISSDLSKSFGSGGSDFSVSSANSGNSTPLNGSGTFVMNEHGIYDLSAGLEVSLNGDEEDDEEDYVYTPTLTAVLDGTHSFAEDIEQDDKPKITQYFKTIDSVIENLTARVNCKNWNKKGNVEEMPIYRMESEDGFACMKTELKISRSAKVVFELLKSFETRILWDPFLKSVEVVEVLDNRSEIVYVQFYGKSTSRRKWDRSVDSCILKMSRDYLLLTHWFMKNGSYINIGQSVEHPKCPTKKDMVRGEVRNSGYIITPLEEGKSCTVTYSVEMDLKSLPTPILNVILNNHATNLSSLRRYAQGKSAHKT